MKHDVHWIDNDRIVSAAAGSAAWVAENGKHRNVETERNSEMRGRPPKYDGNTRLRVRPEGTSRLQPESDRRAIVNAMIDHGGIMTLKELDDHFGIRVRSKALALARAGWLEVLS